MKGGKSGGGGGALMYENIDSLRPKREKNLRTPFYFCPRYL